MSPSVFLELMVLVTSGFDSLQGQNQNLKSGGAKVYDFGCVWCELIFCDSYALRQGCVHYQLFMYHVLHFKRYHELIYFKAFVFG